MSIFISINKFILETYYFTTYLTILIIYIYGQNLKHFTSQAATTAARTTLDYGTDEQAIKKSRELASFSTS
jgi:cation transport ATPase